jgi:S-DNA-T family DNA segregation ATPase FtsK/SpoIIIE
MLSKLLPAVMLLGSLGFVAVLGPSNPTAWLFGGMFAISTLGMVLGGGYRGGANRQATVDEDRRDYLRYLALMRTQVRTVAAEQRAALEAVHPDPLAWPAVLAAGRLWERRPADADFGQLRIGRGTQRLATELVAPQTGPVDGIEPVTALALRRFLRAYAVVADLPVALSLRRSTTVWLEAAGPDLRAALALARALVAQYVLWHSPTDALVAIVAGPGRAPEWEWVKWLPHVEHPRRRSAAGPLRMVADDVDDVRRWWVPELAADRPDVVGEQRHLLLVLDDVGDGPGPWAAVAGVTVLRIGAPPGRRPGPSVVRLLVGPERLGRGGPGDAIEWIGRPDGLAVPEARALARRLARYRPAGAAADEERGPGAVPGLPALLGLASAAPARAELVALRERRRESPPDRLRVPIGVDERGAPVLLDLKESAQGGHGPHGLCVGATGSGKSELLRTLVLGLVATHPSDELNLVLVDFKGGATFLGLAELPHVSAVITNLADELTLVDRMADALAGEITRRQELLRAAGNLVNLPEYEAARQRHGSGLPPLPALVVIVDEFSELLAQRPELVELLVTIGRLGRSLGLHLLLASQRLDEGRLRGLESHLSYRIALRTNSAAESRSVLGVPDAHQLPPTPGSAFLATGTAELVRFRAAYVSGAVPTATPLGNAASARIPPHLFFAGPGREPEPSTPAADPPPAAAPTVLATVVAALSGVGPAAHRVWLPPLSAPPPLDELLGAPRPSAGRGLVVPHAEGALRVPIGQIDRPYQQRRDPLVLDLSGATGHLAVVGGPRSGKSTTLVTALLGLALTHTPEELGMHVLDFGGGALGPLAGLPHVGTVADRHRPELVRRSVAELSAALDRRERLFREAGLASVEEFRASRAGGAFADEPATDLLLVIDGYSVLRGEFDDLEARLLPLAARGLSYGVHLAVTANRWSELRAALKDLLGSRVELRLGEPAESEVDRRKAAAVPPAPGHALAPNGAPAVLAAPRLADGGGTDALVAWIAQECPLSAFPPVRLLPTRIGYDQLPPAGSDAHGVPIGVDEDRLALVAVDFAAEPHLVCFADAESGKTTLLRVLARGISALHGPNAARLVVVDYRRGLLGALPETHLIGYVSTPDATADAAREVADSLRRRLPGPDVPASELRERSWWSGPEVYVLVDDYDLVAPAGAVASAHPLAPLVEFLPQAKDVGLHVVVTRRCGGAGRAVYDPLLGRLRELAVPGLVMNGSPTEGALVETVKPAALPPGRGTLVDRRRGARRVQLAWLPPDPVGP